MDMSNKAVAKVGGTVTAAVLLGSFIVPASPAMAQRVPAPTDYPTGCVVTTKNVNHQTTAMSSRGKCGSKKFTNREQNGKGKGKIGNASYKYKKSLAKKATNGTWVSKINGKIGKKKVKGTYKSRVGNYVNQRSTFLEYGSLRYRGKTYRYSLKGYLVGLGTNYQSVTVKRGSKKLPASNTIRTLVSIISINSQG